MLALTSACIIIFQQFFRGKLFSLSHFFRGLDSAAGSDKLHNPIISVKCDQKVQEDLKMIEVQTIGWTDMRLCKNHVDALRGCTIKRHPSRRPHGKGEWHLLVVKWPSCRVWPYHLRSVLLDPKSLQFAKDIQFPWRRSRLVRRKKRRSVPSNRSVLRFWSDQKCWKRPQQATDSRYSAWRYQLEGTLKPLSYYQSFSLISTNKQCEKAHLPKFHWDVAIVRPEGAHWQEHPKGTREDPGPFWEVQRDEACFVEWMDY